MQEREREHNAQTVPDQQKICRVCSKQFARYTCPRCRLQYCSSICYRQHGEQCTEQFFRESAEKELRSTVASDEQREEMQEILRRVHDSDDGGAALAAELGLQLPADLQDQDSDVEDDSTETQPLSTATLERLLIAAKLDSTGDFEFKPEHLNDKELALFNQWVSTEEAQKAIPCWTPWWHLPAASDLRLTVQGTIPVQPLSQGDILYRADPGVTDSQATAPSAHPDMVAGSSPIKTAGEAHIHRDTTASCSSGQPSGMPSPPEAPVPPLRLAGGRDASPLVRWRVLQLLYGYTLVARCYNGDWSTDPARAASYIFASAPFLGLRAAGEPPQTGKEAAVAAVISAAAPGGVAQDDRRLANLILADVATITSLGRPPVLCVLAEVQRLLTCAIALGDASVKTTEFQGRNWASSAQDMPSSPANQGDVREPARSGNAATDLVAADCAALSSMQHIKALKGRQRQLRIARTQISDFFLPWANKQPPVVYADISSTAAKEWVQWSQLQSAHPKTSDVQQKLPLPTHGKPHIVML